MTTTQPARCDRTGRPGAVVMTRALVIATALVLAAPSGFAQAERSAPASTAAQASPATHASGRVATRIATLPEGSASFGAVASNGWLYVYGGHVVPTHNYSTEAVSGRFNRMRLADGTWEQLAGGPPLQGMNLAEHAGRIYRVGGMQPRNAPGQPADTRSVADVARFDPASGRWDALTPLPTPRSSHDVVVVGTRLFVIGGWEMKGTSGATAWPKQMDVLDLAAATPVWTAVAQPFTRRAFIAATDGTTIFVLGGFDERSRVVRGMDMFDVATGTWSAGPALPGGPMNGFGAAAAVVDGRLYVSVDDGSIHRLNANRSAWEPVGRATPRIVHRLIPDGRRLIVAGGAAGGKNSDLVEALPLDSPVEH